ncbi:MAG: DUF3467 domain-containing protein [Acidobacteriota bacterium]|nr:DUF3467 domain-containing protein [Acidobacteriota bacterium]
MVPDDVGTEEQEKSPGPVDGRCANYFTMAFTHFEFLLDFGQAYDTPGAPFLHTRIIMTPHSAQTFSRMMQDIVRQYEEAVGPIPQGRS